MTKTTKTIPITEHALVQRMRRRLAEDGGTLHVTRRQHRSHLGCFYATANSAVEDWWQTLDQLVMAARELGVLAPYEVLEGAS